MENVIIKFSLECGFHFHVERSSTLYEAYKELVNEDILDLLDIELIYENEDDLYYYDWVLELLIDEFRCCREEHILLNLPRKLLSLKDGESIIYKFNYKIDYTDCYFGIDCDYWFSEFTWELL